MTNPIYNLSDKEIQKRLIYDKEFRSIVANELVELRKQNIISSIWKELTELISVDS